MMATTHLQFRSLGYYEKEDVRQLCFDDTLKPVKAVPLGEVVEIIWSPCHPEAVERNAPDRADAYRIVEEPRRRLGLGETAIVQYYKLLSVNY